MSESISERSESVFYKAFNSSTSIIMGVTTLQDGIYVDVNEAFLNITGYSRHEVVGKSSVSLGIVTDEYRNIMKQRLLEKGRIENYELSFVTKDKKIRSLMCFAEIISVDGEQKLLTIAHDITELNSAKKELGKEQALLRAVFESTQDGFVIKDLNSVYQKASPAFCHFAGITEIQAIGKTDFDFFPESEAIKYCAEDQEIIKTGLTKEFDRNFRSQNGLVWCQTIKTPVRDSNGLISGVLCTVRDISRKKRFEELLNSRLCISNYSFSSSLPDLFQKVLSESERLTESQFSFFHFVDDINKMIHLNTWSEKAVKICNMKTYEKSYSLDKAGV